MAKRVAVIGAGPAGLVTVKELLAEGHQVICFERASGLGGVFRFGEDDGVVWESCRLTSSGLLTVFSDFPDPFGRTGHLTVGQYVEYLTAYAAAFGVTPHLRFGASVEAVTPHPDGGWQVRTRDADAMREESFDAVVVCSGLHQHPHIPHFPGVESFKGTVLHSAHYRRPNQIAGKKVLIVGAGESGADVVAEVAKNAAETVLSLRRGVAVQPRNAFGVPRDYLTTRLLNSTPNWVFQTRHPADEPKRRRYRMTFAPLVVVDKMLQLLYRFFWEYLPLFASRDPAERRTNVRTRALTNELLMESGGTANEQFGTKSDDFLRAMANGQCRRVAGISRFEGQRVTFEDGSSFEPDLVLLCTGFRTQAPFLDPATANASRYLHVFNPTVGPSLGFVGFVRPAFGAIPPLAELQARWFALVLSGKLALPATRVMQESIEHWRMYHAQMFRALPGRLQHLVDYTPFCDEIASQIGCKPTQQALRHEPLGFRIRFFAAPFVSAQYRLIGPHARPDIARSVIGSLPITHPLPDLINLYLRWTMSRALHRLHGPEYAPKLALP